MAEQRVLITGGALRLGAEFCLAFGATGWHVLCHCNRSRTEAEALQQRLRAAGMHIDVVQADLANGEQRAQLFEHILDRFGPVDGLINNASLFEPDTGLEWESEQARRQLEVNLLAPLSLASLLAKQATEPATETPSRFVIHVLDQKVLNLNPDYFSYTISKLALERAVALQAQALAPHARVCGVAPGLLYESGPQSTANWLKASRVNLLRRPTSPADVAQTALFLARTPSITGVTIAVDNGQHLVPLERDVMFVVEELLGNTTSDTP
ncbi:SDR family NAD(P)-dependent oxidoreductase [Tepidicella xavieri]|nr:SDR family NAD(P)-dependent oxidoreductase [Tepidicella xavieri]